MGAALIALHCVAGCAVSVPIASFTASEDTTGSIPHLKPLSLDGEDWRRADAALGTALDPQGAGTPVNWDNPTSGVKGAFTPVGAAYSKDAKICRAFLADISAPAGDRALQGTACFEKGGDWSITEARPWKRA